MTILVGVALGVVAGVLLGRRVGPAARRAHFEQAFRQVAAALDQVIWLTTPDKSETLYVSPAYERVFGQTCDSLYAAPLSFLDIIHPEDRVRVAAALPQQLAGRWDQEYRIVLDGGTIRWIRSRAFPIRDAAGAVYRIAGIAEDVTERRDAEAAVARYVSLLRATLEAVGDGLVAIDRAGRVEFYNERFAAVVGGDVDTRGSLAARLGALVARPAGWALDVGDGPRVIEFRDGRVFEVRAQPRGAAGGAADTAGHVWSFHDVTDEHRSAQLLRESEEKFWKAFRSSPDTVCIATRADGRLLDVNERFVDLTGYGRDEALGRTAAALGIWGDAAEQAELAHLLATGQGARNLELRVRRKTGETRIALLSVEPIELDGVACVVGIARDITERKRAEEQLRNLARRLETVREQERAGIAREIHDELGQALTGLRIDLSWIGKRLPSGAAEARGLRGRIRAMVAQLDATIDTVQRIATDLRPSVLDDLGLAAAIEWQSTEFERRTGIAARVSLNGNRPELDRQRAITVFRILQEALTNVARHAAARRVEVALRVTPAGAALTVRDDGRGITPAEVESPRALGVLGMRERALAWGGSLDVQRARARGTVVTLQLPLDHPAPAEEGP